MKKSKNPDSYQQLFQTISEEIRQMQANMEAHLPLIEQEVNFIVSTKVTDALAIEHLLDTLLNWQYMGVGETLFIRLLEYYKTIDSEAAADYRNFFDEISA